jgi:hypothetical protein
MERKQDARKGEQPQQPPRPEVEDRPGAGKDQAQAEGDEPLDLRVRTLRTENDESGGH